MNENFLTLYPVLYLVVSGLILGLRRPISGSTNVNDRYLNDLCVDNRIKNISCIKTFKSDTYTTK